MRQLTKAEACRELAVSLSTLDRRIAAGEIEVRRERHGRRHRIYVMLDDDPLKNGLAAKSQGTLLDVAQERIRGLQEQAELLQAQLGLERERNAGLEEACRKERAGRDRMRRVVLVLGLAVAGLFGMLVASVLVV
ncbi:MAG: hypothetical protein OYI31_08310 [Chloroflexota bacterium]|nr:hypothetical protein [Chloroflexota bacterium]MDE2940934.1 hypothetical protein [Chloroflexota bacterium]MDE3268433.1 hypothetical protein [Chloroflexota bacterium]